MVTLALFSAYSTTSGLEFLRGSLWGLFLILLREVDWKIEGYFTFCRSLKLLTPELLVVVFTSLLSLCIQSICMELLLNWFGCSSSIWLFSKSHCFVIDDGLAKKCITLQHLFFVRVSFSFTFENNLLLEIGFAKVCEAQFRLCVNSAMVWLILLY